MSIREQFRSWLGIKANDDPNTPKVNDEELLNVLREEQQKEDGEEELTTKEIAEKLPVVRKTVSNRLKELEGERVNKRRAGPTDMWSLAEGEPKTVVNPEMGRVVEYSSKAKRKSTEIAGFGRKFAEIGFVLLIAGMSIWLSEITFPNLLVAGFLGFGYSSGIVGGSIIGAAACLRLFGILSPVFVERFLIE